MGMRGREPCLTGGGAAYRVRALAKGLPSALRLYEMSRRDAHPHRADPRPADAFGASESSESTAPRLSDDHGDFERRLDAKLAERRAKEAERNRRPQGAAAGLRYGAEFAGGIIAGGLLGYAIDVIAGWSPWGLLAGVALGFAAGMRNVVRAARELNEASSRDADQD